MYCKLANNLPITDIYVSAILRVLQVSDSRNISWYERITGICLQGVQTNLMRYFINASKRKQIDNIEYL